MVLTTFVKVSIAVGIITLACLVIVALLNIYWYSDEVEPALEDCVGPHLKMVANAILLMFGIIAGIVFGIGTYRLSNVVYEDDDNPPKPVLSSEIDNNEINKMTPLELKNSTESYASIIKEYKTQIESYYKAMIDSLNENLGPKNYYYKDDEGKQIEIPYLTTAKNNIEIVGKLNAKAIKNVQTARGLYSMITNKPESVIKYEKSRDGTIAKIISKAKEAYENFRNTPKEIDKDTTPLVEGPIRDLRNLFVETRQLAINANYLNNRSLEAFRNLNDNIKSEHYKRSMEK